MNENAGADLSLDPVDWEQLELLARLTPAERALAMMRAQAFVMAGLRGAFARRFPELSQADLVPLSREPTCRQAFTRRIRRTFRDEAGARVVDLWTRLREQAAAEAQAHSGHSSATDRAGHA